jgi:curved DNA-binding protein
MNIKDYYQILGIPKTASADEIKKAYRKLALRYHPDKTKGDKVAISRFTEINEANQVLSDPDKRKKYDQFGADYKNYENAGGEQSGFDWSKYSHQNTSQNSDPHGGGFDTDFSNSDYVDLYELLFGKKSSAGYEKKTRPSRGNDLSGTLSISLSEAYFGTSREIAIDGQVLSVAIPKGIADGQILRLAKKGMPGSSGGLPGDAFLSVKIEPDRDFIRKGNDLHRTIPVDLYTLILGGKTLVKTLKGAVKVSIPKETPNLKILRLQGLGMPHFGKQNLFGDLFVTVQVKMLLHLTQEEIDLFQKLSTLRK